MTHSLSRREFVAGALTVGFGAAWTSPSQLALAQGEAGKLTGSLANSPGLDAWLRIATSTSCTRARFCSAARSLSSASWRRA